MFKDFLDIVNGKSGATVKVQCNFYEMCKVSQALMDALSNVRTIILWASCWAQLY